ncbi:Hypothetical predicted protein [Paramuricea clavata]|uniref:Uncharacterized protein n=1 Tax=Paramuricea clavata TaxID=317549 RepID=A0A6S7GF66_PARCT|nr:Hypothetical predicted protein [Paramuricea clavata]
MDEVRGQGIIVGGDGQCDSPGFNAKNLCYYKVEVGSKYILHVEIVDKRHVGLVSSNMEIELVTDASTSVKKLLGSNKHDCLRKAQVPSVEKFIYASNICKDDCFDRLHIDIDNLTSREILWHNSCYASYTSERNLRSLSTGQTGSPQVNEVSLKSQRNRPLIDWTKCIFCRNASRKRDFKLINIVTFEACNSIRTAAEARGKEELLPVLRTVDLIASEGKNHKSCHASYVSKANIKSQCINGKPVNEYQDSFAEFLDIIRPEILKGKVYNTNYLLQLYKDMLTKRDVNADSYTRQKLKLCLKLVFNDSLVFHQPHGSTKPEIVYSSSISLLGVINIATRTTENTTTSVAAQNEFIRDDPNESIKIINKAAVIFRNDLSMCKGIKIDSLSLEDLHIQKARTRIPDNLYWLVRYMVSLEVYAADQSPKASNVSHERKILMICQDVVHAASNARVKLPKHVSLALANETIARSELNEGVIIPSNISPGVFVHMAADNNDFNEETIDGKNTTHATTFVAFERKQHAPATPPMEIYVDHSQRKRSLDLSRPIVTVEDINVGGRRPAVTNYVNKMTNASWLQPNDNFLSACQDDLEWLILRMHSHTMFEENYQTVDAQKIRGWSGFQSLRFSDPSTPTSIGYLPMIQADANEYSTINTVMKLSLKMANALGQSESVVTFDLAIYVKAKQLQMRYPGEFKNVVARLGGFHIALNYLSLLGKMYSNSGLEDLLTESGVYAPGTTTALIAGKSYNRGVRAHKLCFEALFRLMWKTFASWLEETAQGLDEILKTEALELLNQCQDSDNKEEYLKENWHSLKDGLSALVHLFKEFENEGKVKSQLFAFWSEYMSMVSFLLQFINAERTGNWNLHLSSTKMLPYFYAMDKSELCKMAPCILGRHAFTTGAAPRSVF